MQIGVAEKIGVFRGGAIGPKDLKVVHADCGPETPVGIGGCDLGADVGERGIRAGNPSREAIDREEAETRVGHRKAQGSGRASDG